MNNYKPILLFTAIGIILGWFLSSAFSCNRVPAISLPTISATPKLIYRQWDTVTRVELQYRDRWHVRNVAATSVIYDTTEVPILSQPYIATLDTVTASRDTVNISFRHPSKRFDLDFRPRPDSTRTVTITETNVVSIPDSKRWGIGLNAGVGVGQGFDGVIRPSVGVGVGVNFNLWEP